MTPASSRTSALSLVLAPALALALALALGACKKDQASEAPGVVDGVAKDVEREIDGAGGTAKKTAEDVEGAGEDVAEAIASTGD